MNNEKLIGRYVMDYDTLEILPNRTYIHHLNSKTERGTWKLNSTRSEVVLDNFTFNSDNGRGVWYSRIILANNKIRLNVNSDISNGYYEKVPNE